jgi:hypothetical protein
MSPRGPTAHSLEDRLDGLAGEVKDLGKAVRDLGNDVSWVERIGALITTLLVAALVGCGRVAWIVSGLDSEREQQGRRLDRLEKRLDGIDKKLDTLIGRTPPVTKGG